MRYGRYAGVSPVAPPVTQPSLLALGGMGGSAIAGELTAALVADRAPRPFLVVRDYRWPACVDRTALAVLSSYSGDTEETLALAHEAIARGVPCAAITGGGTLTAMAGERSWPLHRLPGGMPPRAALFHNWFSNIIEQTTAIFTDAQGVTRSVGIQMNAAKAKMLGGELQVEVLPTDWLELSGSYQYLMARYTKYPSIDPVTLVPLDLKDRTFPYAPRHNGNDSL